MRHRISFILADGGWKVKPEMHISEVLDTTVTTVTNKQKPTVTTVTIGDSKGDKFQNADQLFSQFPDLVNEQFRAWYCRHFYRLGTERVIVLASQARADGFNKRKLFSYLLKIS